MTLSKLEKLIKEFGISRKLQWCWVSLSSNPCVSMEFIRDNPHLPWSFNRGVSNNPNLDEITIIRNIGMNWDYQFLSKCRKLTCFVIELLYRRNPDFCCFNFSEVSRTINISEIAKKIDSPMWSWDDVSNNPSLTFEFVKDNMDKEWNWIILSSHKCVSMKNIIDNPNLAWVFDNVCMNPNLTIDIFKRYPDKKWLKYSISKSPGLTIEIIKFVNGMKNSSYYGWSIYEISKHPNINMRDIDDNINMMMWDKKGLCENPNLSIWFFKKYRHIFFNSLCDISSSTTINIMKIVDAFPDEKWLWTNISGNNNICPKFIEKYMDKNWNHYNLSRNTCMSEKYIEKHIYSNNTSTFFTTEMWMNGISRYCDFSVNFVKKYSDKINFANLSKNTFRYGIKSRRNVYVMNAMFASVNWNVHRMCSSRLIQRFL